MAILIEVEALIPYLLCFTVVLLLSQQIESQDGI